MGPVFPPLDPRLLHVFLSDIISLPYSPCAHARMISGWGDYTRMRTRGEIRTYVRIR